jgi:hypothetical protein
VRVGEHVHVRSVHLAVAVPQSTGVGTVDVPQVGVDPVTMNWISPDDGLRPHEVWDRSVT